VQLRREGIVNQQDAMAERDHIERLRGANRSVSVSRAAKGELALVNSHGKLHPRFRRELHPRIVALYKLLQETVGGERRRYRGQ